MKIILTLAALTIVTLVASASTMQLNFTVALTVQEQSAITKTNGTLVTYNKPVLYKFATKDVLAGLARAEFFVGNYPSPTFPTGSKLIFQNDFDDGTQSKFVVTSSTGIVLCDVSAIMTLNNDSNPAIKYGTFNGAENSPDKPIYTYITSLNYDDTNAGGDTKFYIGGVVVETITESANKKTNLFTSVHSLKFSNLSGSGTTDAGGLVITGTVAASGQ